MSTRAAKLDQIDMEIAGLRRLQHRATVARLEELGFDTSRYTAPRFPHRLETNAGQHARSEERAREDYLAHGPPRRSMNGQPLLVRRAVGQILGVS